MEENPSVPDKVELTSMDMTDDRIEDLKAVFPEAFHDGKIDFDYLRSALGDWVEPEKERFGLTWAGKAQCMKVIQQPSIGTLVPMREESVEFDTTENLIIEGDNLEVLKLLQKSYYGKVKMIYIDPPYNTGNEFIYPDDYKEGLGEYLRYSGQVDSEGLKLTANSESDGRYHSKWLSMMYPRLYLARNLLRDDGVIFISIDDNEVDNLKKVCIEIFGEENFIGLVTRITKTTSDSGRFFAPSTDFVVVFGRNAISLDEFKVPLSSSDLSSYTKQDERGKYKLVGFYQASLTLERSRNARYWITAPDGSKCIPPEGKRWRTVESTFKVFLQNNEIEFVQVTSSPLIDLEGNKSKWNVYTKQYLDRRSAEGRTPRTFISDIPNHLGTHEIDELNIPFSFPKPTALPILMLQMVGVSKQDIILDFFAGSGTTAHAVMAQNAKDGGNRKFILVQLPEPTDREDFPTISAITRERVRRAGKAILSEQPALGYTPPDCGFKAYKLTTSNFKVWDSENDEEKSVQRAIDEIAVNVVQGRSEEDILTELLLKSGYSLTTSVTQVICQDKQVYSVEGGKLLICLEKELAVETFEAMADLEPEMIIILDAGFEGKDELKVNAMETIRLRNRHKNSDIVLRVV